MKKNECSQNSSVKRPTPSKFQCPYCQSTTPPVEVHGHIQCSQCGINVGPCCEGAPSEETEEKGDKD